MIKAIFFSKFDVDEGSSKPSPEISQVLHQVPANSIVPSAESAQIPLFHFPDVSSYIIPRQEFCSGILTVVTNSYRILGHPVCLPSPLYPRNEFLFNFCLVLDSATEFSAHLTVTLKLATLLRTLEEQSRFLSRDASPPNTGKIYALCEILLEDLNNYCESMIPIDDYNTLNIKLFPTYPPPPPLLPHHVPLSTVRLSSLVDQNWDLTMLLILPHINGVNSVAQIALAADADYQLVRKAIRHLLYYNCIFLLDIFSFSAIYAPTAELASFVESPQLQDECARYVTIPYSDDYDNHNDDHSGHGNGMGPPLLGDDLGALISGTELAQLYCSLKQGQSVRHFFIEHAAALDGIDIRRFIIFGVIKGFLYRVHKYAIAISPGGSSSSRRLFAAHRAGKNKDLFKSTAQVEEDDDGEQGRDNDNDNNDDDDDNDVGDGAESGIAKQQQQQQTKTKKQRKSSKADLLTPYLDGTHCFDEICTELQISEKELVARLKEWTGGCGSGGGEVQIIHR
ncbi:Nitrogen permease regulator 2 [Pseudocyphellaria aurata]|nr:Nitrogen permease regulator 2 [Pseudocyphellaria aurata]